MTEYLNYIPFIVGGVIILFLIRCIFLEIKKDPSEKKFNLFLWFKASFEEKDGRASGKAITVFCFVCAWITTHFCILFRATELTDSQYKLIDSSMNGMMYLIISLYTIKKAGETRFFGESKNIPDISQSGKTETKPEVKPENIG